MDGEKIISLFNEAKEKASIISGIDKDSLNDRSDETRQLICLISKELNEYLYVSGITFLDSDVCKYLEDNGYSQLVKILDALNYF